MSHKKSQIVMTDLVVAVFIFLFLVLLVFSMWSFQNMRLQDNLNFEDMQVKAFQISNILVKSKGTPTDWENNYTTAEMVGLAEQDRILSKVKVTNFTKMPYSNVSTLLKLGKYNTSLNISDLDGNTVTSFGNKTSGKNVVEIKRFVRYNDQTNILSLRIWE